MNKKSTPVKILTVVILTLLLFIVALEILQTLYPVSKQFMVIDGDTIQVIYGNKNGVRRRAHIRYACIDTPEKNEPFFMEAKLENEKFIKDKEITFDTIDTDKYGRKVAYVYVSDKISLFHKIMTMIGVGSRYTKNVNKELLYNGWAVYYDFSGKCSNLPELLEAQKHAFDNNRGIWNFYTKFKYIKFIKGNRTFHTHNCKIARSKSKEVITLKEAIYKGLSPCKACKPLVNLSKNYAK